MGTVPSTRREPLWEHTAMCSGEHWEVMHSVVFVRSSFSIDSSRVGLLSKGNVICLGHAQNDNPRSPDGEWVRCAKDAVHGPCVPFHSAAEHDRLLAKVWHEEIGSKQRD